MNDFNNPVHEENYYNQYQLPDLTTQQINTNDSTTSNIQNNNYLYFQSSIDLLNEDDDAHDTNHDEIPHSTILQPTASSALAAASSSTPTTITTQNNNISNSSGSSMNNVDFPFVRIHAFDSAITSDPNHIYGRIDNNNLTTTITNNNNNREIKPKIEPIKSELNDIQQNQATTTTSTTTSSSPQNRLPQTPEEDDQPEQTTPEIIIAQENPEIKILKCKQCLYLTICPRNLNNHIMKVHRNVTATITSKSMKFTCPGCENIFYTEIALSCHLENDHLMQTDELRTFLEYQCIQKQTIDTRKSRIYLKNVECLREQPPQTPPPAPQPPSPQLNIETEILNRNNQFNDDTDDDINGYDNELTLIDLINVDSLPPYNENDELMIEKIQPLAPLSLTPQKITIKSVENLREPFFLQQKQQHHQQSIGSTSRRDPAAQQQLLSSRPRIDISEAGLPTQQQKQQLLSPTSIGSHTNRRESTNQHMLGPGGQRIVDFSEIGLSPLQQQQQQQHHQSTNNLNFPDPIYNQSGNKIYYNMDTGYNSTNSDTNVRLYNNRCGDIENKKSSPRRAPKIYIKNVDILKEPIYVPPINSSNILNVNETLNFNILSSRPIQLQSHASSSPIGVGGAPPTLCNNNGNNFDISNPVNKQHNFTESYNSNSNNCKTYQTLEKSKIYIKNVDILKQPHFKENNNTKKSTNFLHLRTVDELNLMNKNQLNLMNNLQHQNHHNNNYQDLINPSSDNSKNSDEIIMSNNYDFAQHFSSTNQNNADTSTPHSTEHNETEIMTQTNWSTNYHGFENLETMTVSNSPTILTGQKNHHHHHHHHYDLNTPQRLPIIDDDNNNIENENEILLVCAEELIGNQENLINNDTHNDTNIMTVDSNIYHDTCNNSSSDSTSKIIEETTGIEIVELSDDLKNQENYDCIVEIPDERSNDDNNTFNTINLEEEEEDGENVVDTITEKGRIYVSENLMMKDRTVQLENCNVTTQINQTKKKAKGRPVGSKSNRLMKCKKTGENGGTTVEDFIEFKCDFTDCAYRFKLEVTLEYHRKCHIGETPHSMQCPDCNSLEFSSWNTLHTHLWRNHKIDMELYSCELCNFKTPILSRLLNTHSKIHSDERNFKCDQCDKAFKNSKQLKNHRRLHRTTWKKPIELLKCDHCTSIFSTSKSKKEHFCQQQLQAQAQPSTTTISISKCTVCEKLCSSKSALKLHLLTHDLQNRFKCNHCDYVTNDHNAFRRHKSTHDKSKMYECLYCDYKCIQSVLYKKHIINKHPEYAANIVHKCTICTFSTINQTQYHVHVAKHDNQILENTSNNNETTTVSINVEEMTVIDDGNKVENLIFNENQSRQHKNKIKVKSDLVLTDPSKFLLQTSNDVVT